MQLWEGVTASATVEKLDLEWCVVSLREEGELDGDCIEEYTYLLNIRKYTPETFPPIVLVFSMSVAPLAMASFRKACISLLKISMHCHKMAS